MNKAQPCSTKLNVSGHTLLKSGHEPNRRKVVLDGREMESICWGKFPGAAGQGGFQADLFETKRYMIVFVTNVLTVRQLTLRIGVQCM
jgi:hypothetical protein